MKDVTRLLFEVSGEVCYKMGGIYTSIVSKISYVQRKWGDRYFLAGAYIPGWQYEGVFQEGSGEEISYEPVRYAVCRMKELNIKVFVGRWLVEGHPLVILFDPFTLPADFRRWMSEYLKINDLTIPSGKGFADVYMAFGYCLSLFFEAVCGHPAVEAKNVILHFHEYMTTVALPEIRQMQIRTVFTAHATVKGRYLASLKRSFHEYPEADPEPLLKKMPVYHKFCAGLERIAARECHVLTAVSPLVARECRRFLEREPQLITPNGLNTRSLLQQMPDGRMARKAIDQLVQLHFKTHADRQEVLGKKIFYFFSSGRYEYKNKGYDIIIRALSRLNDWMRRYQPDSTVVMFFITNEPNPDGTLLENALRRMGAGLTSVRRLRRADLFLFKVSRSVRNCLLVKDLERHGLHNKTTDKVKVLYHPRFLSVDSLPLYMDYLSFISGCDLGLFPSYYEPWGYTPQECICAGIPAVTSNLSGIGKFLEGQDRTQQKDLFIVDRTFNNGEEELYRVMRDHIADDLQDRQERGGNTLLLDWESLIACYTAAHTAAAEEMMNN